MEIAEFLLARIAEDEARANAFEQADPVPFQWSSIERLGFPPKRVRAECKAKRRIVEQCQRLDAKVLNDNLWNISEQDEILCLLALPYADHDGYREEWKP